MIKFIKTIFMLGAMTLAGTAAAVPITGSIGFTGAYAIETGNNLGDATELSFSGVEVNGTATGDFSGLLGDPANFSNLVISDPFASQLLWNVGGFSFTANTLNIITQSSVALVVSGVGTISHANFDDTSGTWVYSVNTGLTFSAGTVPAPGIALLLGVGLVGISLARKMRKA